MLIRQNNKTIEVKDRVSFEIKYIDFEIICNIIDAKGNVLMTGAGKDRIGMERAVRHINSTLQWRPENILKVDASWKITESDPYTNVG